MALMLVTNFSRATILIILLLAATMARANEEGYIFSLQWGSYYALYPKISDVAVDKDGNIYLLDKDNSRIQKFDGQGNFLLEWGELGKSDGQFDLPKGFALDEAGNIYVADTENNRVQKFDREGNFLFQWGKVGNDDGEFKSPAGIAVDREGNVYVTESGNHRLQRFDSSGKFLNKWGSLGGADVQFDHPEGVAVDGDGNVYLADAYNHRIQKFDKDGNFLVQWGIKGRGGGQFNRPEGITVDTLGDIYVADTGNHRIQKFDSQGNFLLKWGKYGSRDGEFKRPAGLVVDTSGNVYVADTENFRIQKLDNNNQFLSKIVTPGEGLGQFNQPEGIAIDSGGNIFITDTDNHRVQKFDSQGNFLLKWGSSGIGDTEFNQPKGITADRSGNIYIADEKNRRIKKFDSEGKFLWGGGTYGSGAGQFKAVSSIGIDQDGNIYVVDRLNHCVQKFDSYGNFLFRWGSEGSNAGQFVHPYGIVINKENYIYVVDMDNQRIQKFDQDGNFLLQWGSKGSNEGQFKYPEGIATDVAGNIYIADTGNHRIQKFDSQGNFLLKWGSIGGGAGQLRHPAGLAIDNANNIYIADTENSRIQKFIHNYYPNIPGQPLPEDGAIKQKREVTLMWLGGDPDGRDTLSYDIFLGTTTLPVYLATRNQPAYTVSALEPATTYYWKIVAKDDQGFAKEGPLWKFFLENVSLYGKVNGVANFEQLLVLVLPSPLDPVRIDSLNVRISEVDSQGHYKFADLAGGLYNIYVTEKNNFKIKEGYGSVNVAEREVSEVNLNVELTAKQSAGTIFGRIENKANNPLPGLVVLKSLAEEIIGLGMTGADAKFSFLGLRNEKYKILVIADQYLAEEIVTGIDEIGQEQELNVVLNYPAIDLSKGATIYSGDGKVKLEIPSGAFSQRTGIVITNKAAVYQIRAISVINQENCNLVVSGKKVKFSLNYDVGTDNKIAQQFRIHHLKDNRWIHVAGPQEIDLAEKRVSCWLTEFSQFRLLLSAGNNLGNLVVYPNPYKPNSGLAHQGISFSGLTGQFKIEIYTLAGQKVREIEEDNSSGSYPWNGRNSDGENLSSGVYLYVVTSNNGEKKTGKIAIIR